MLLYFLIYYVDKIVSPTNNKFIQSQVCFFFFFGIGIEEYIYYFADDTLRF